MTFFLLTGHNRGSVEPNVIVFLVSEFHCVFILRRQLKKRLLCAETQEHFASYRKRHIHLIKAAVK